MGFRDATAFCMRAKGRGRVGQSDGSSRRLAAAVIPNGRRIRGAVPR